ncbi:MAG: GNAT family N-acetyltransferase [Gammaproteobacteria bacterium]|nr:GNAT family N-acetyltransferase [Gammaproteobacteria bacterium]
MHCHPPHRFSTDPAEITPEAVHNFLRNSYWAAGRSLAHQRAAMSHSLNYGLLADGQLLAYARVVSDRTTFAYLCDVIVHPAHRGRGLGKTLLAEVHARPELQGLRRWLLATRDAHGLYAGYGWQPLANVPVWMEQYRPDAEPVHD